MIEKYIGIPWAQGKSSFDEADCWGLVCLYLQNECGITLHKHLGATHTGLFLSDVIGEECLRPEWVQQTGAHPHTGDVVVMFDRVTARPGHVGVCIDSFTVLHSIHAGPNGFSQVNKINVLQRIFHKLEFYKYAGNLSPQ